MDSLPPGVYGGTIEGAAGGTFVMVTRDLWGQGSAEGRMFYGLDAEGPARVGGVVLFSAGYGCNSADLRAVNAVDDARGFYVGQYDSYLYVSLDPAAPKVSGSLRSLDGKTPTRAMNGGLIPGSTYKPRAVPVLYDVAGHWATYDARGIPGYLLVGSDGSLEGSYGGCAIAGTVQPAADGTNLFDVHLKTKLCASAGLVFEEYVGYLVALPLATGGMQVLFWAEWNNGMDAVYLLAAGQR